MSDRRLAVALSGVRAGRTACAQRLASEGYRSWVIRGGIWALVREGIGRIGPPSLPPPAEGLLIVRDTERAADSMYLIAHDPMSGQALLGRRVLGVGLAAALLGELVGLGLLCIDIDMVLPQRLRPFLRRRLHRDPALLGPCLDSYRVIGVDDAGSPCPRCYTPGVEHVPDTLQSQVWEVIHRERSILSAGDWLRVLADDMPSGVATRLESDGWLCAEPYRNLFGLGRARMRWRPRVYVEAGMPRQCLRMIADGTRIPDDHRRFVGGLVEAVGLVPAVLDGMDEQARRRLAWHAGALSAPLHTILRQAKLAVDTAVMAHAG